MKKNILVADDDASIRFVISKSLTRAGYNVRATDNAHTLLKWVQSGEGDVVLTDVHMEQEDIFNFVPDLKAARPDLPIIIMSANTSVMTALKSGKFGVFEYIPKPFDLKELSLTIERALETGLSEKATIASQESIGQNAMIGKSVAMQSVFRGISDFMSGNVPVFISGDVGTGKNLTAQLIHSSGTRHERPFVHFLDMTSISEVNEQVANGDLFVDRLDELTDAQQGLLLRALEINEQRPDAQKFRPIAASRLPYSVILSDSGLRPEILSHLGGGNIHLPPLSERREDVADLVMYFANQDPTISKKRKFAAKSMNLLKSQIWAGNVRELKNFVQAISLQYSDALIPADIVSEMLSAQRAQSSDNKDTAQIIDKLRNAGRALLIDAAENNSTDIETPYARAIAWIEKPLIEEALKMTNGNNVKAADLLGIHRNTLRTKIKALGINTF